MSIGVIVNPDAGRGKGKGQALAEALAGHENINVHLLNHFSELEPALRHCASQKVKELYISSGDGTIQATITQMIGQQLFETYPRIGILPHGTTNLTAIDLGLKIRTPSAQAQFIISHTPTKFKIRNTLHVLNPSNNGPRHGFTLGGGAAAIATRLTQIEFNDKGRTGQFAAAQMIAAAMIKAITTKADRNDTSRVDRPYAMHISANGKVQAQGDQLMFFATTLEKQFFYSRPFWGGKNGPIRASVFPYPVPNLLRWTLPLMFGGEDRKVPKGAVSFSGDHFEITCNETFVMDGEFFNGPASEPLQVRTGPAFEFIVG